MGFIDAYTFTQLDGTFASAQTGNMVSFTIVLVYIFWLYLISIFKWV